MMASSRPKCSVWRIPGRDRTSPSGVAVHPTPTSAASTSRAADGWTPRRGESCSAPRPAGGGAGRGTARTRTAKRTGARLCNEDAEPQLLRRRRQASPHVRARVWRPLLDGLRLSCVGLLGTRAHRLHRIHNKRPVRPVGRFRLDPLASQVSGVSVCVWVSARDMELWTREYL